MHVWVQETGTHSRPPRAPGLWVSPGVCSRIPRSPFSVRVSCPPRAYWSRGRGLDRDFVEDPGVEPFPRG